MSKINVTFKKEPRSTGLARIGEAVRVNMKIKKKRFGSIATASWNENWIGWKITFAVKDKEGSWRWMKVKQTFQTEELAREYAKECFPKYIDDLWFFEE